MSFTNNQTGLHNIMDFPDKVEPIAFTFDHAEIEVICPRCNGGKQCFTGSHGPTCRTSCGLCDAKGKIILKPGSAVCSDCHGAGQVWKSFPNARKGCNVCEGKGIVGKNVTYKKY